MSWELILAELFVDNVWCIKIRTKLSNVLVLCLVWFLMHQTLVPVMCTGNCHRILQGLKGCYNTLQSLQGHYRVEFTYREIPVVNTGNGFAVYTKKPFGNGNLERIVIFGQFYHLNLLIFFVSVSLVWGKLEGTREIFSHKIRTIDSYQKLAALFTLWLDHITFCGHKKV